MAEQILAAFFVLALLLATLWLLRRKGLARFNFALPNRLSRSNQMRVIDRIPLTAQHSLHLVQIQNRTILVGVSPSGCNRLAAFKDSFPLDEQEIGDDAT